jgi:hypothetical protein
MTDTTPELSDVLHQHGEGWQIQHDPGVGCWTAIRRPTASALHVICAHDLATLAVKLEAASDRGSG